MTDLNMIMRISTAIEGKDGAEQMQALVDVVREISDEAVSEACAALISERNTYRKRYNIVVKDLARIHAERALAAMAVRGDL